MSRPIPDMDGYKKRVIRNHFAGRMFRDVADMDYISARTLFRNDCYDEFLIFSQQCLEKYLKGVLLYNAVVSKQMTHSLMALVTRCRSINHFSLSGETSSFVEKIDGFDQLRYALYMFGSFSAERNFLTKLDYTVMDLRRYCHADKDRAEKLSQVSEESLINATQKGRIAFDGLIEKVQKGTNRKYATLRDNLLWNNPYFSSQAVEDIPNGWWSKGAGLSPRELREAYEELREYIYIPKEVKNHFNRTEE